MRNVREEAKLLVVLWAKARVEPVHLILASRICIIPNFLEMPRLCIWYSKEIILNTKYQKFLHNLLLSHAFRKSIVELPR